MPVPQTFDPSKYGAVKVASTPAFDPSKYGAEPIKTSSNNTPTVTPVLPFVNNSGSFNQANPFDVSIQGQPKTVIDAHNEDKDEGKNILGNLWNRFTTGYSSMSSGVADAAFQGLQKILPKDPYSQGSEADLKKFREEGEPVIRTALTNQIGAKVTPQQEKNFNDNFWTSALGGITESIPAMTAPVGAGFIAQAYDGGLQTINSTPLGKDLSENQKTVFGLGVGAAQGVIMKLGLDKILGKGVDKVATNLTANVLKKLITKSSVPITADAFESALNVAAKELKNKLIKSGSKVAESAGTGFLMGSAIEGTNELAKAITNKAAGDNVFEPETWGQRLGNVMKAGASMAAGSAILGSATLPFSKTRNFISEEVAKAKTPEDIQALKDQVNKGISEGSITPENAAKVSALIDDYAKVHSTIPADVPNKKEVADKIMEREEVKNAAAEKENQLQNVDEAFQPDIQKEVDVLNKKADEINKEIANPEKVAVIKPKTQEEINNQIPDVTIAPNENISEKQPTDAKVILPQTIAKEQGRQIISTSDKNNETQNAEVRKSSKEAANEPISVDDFNKSGYELPSGLKSRGVKELSPKGDDKFDVILNDGSKIKDVLIHKSIKEGPTIDNKSLLTQSDKTQIAYGGKMKEVGSGFKEAAQNVRDNLSSGESGYVKTPDGKVYEISASSKMAKLLKNEIPTTPTEVNKPISVNEREQKGQGNKETISSSPESVSGGRAKGEPAVLEQEMNRKINEVENPKKEIKIKSSKKADIVSKLNKIGNPKAGDVLDINGEKWTVNKAEKRQTFQNGESREANGYRINITSNKKGTNADIYTDTNDFIKHEKSLADIQKIEQIKDEYDQKISNKSPKEKPISKPVSEEAKPIENKKTGKYQTLAKQKADKLRNAELPDWLVNNDPNIKKGGISAESIKNTLADAIELVGKLMDDGVEFAKAVKEGGDKLVAHFLSDYPQGAKLKPEFEQSIRNGFEKEARENFIEEAKSELPPEPPVEQAANESGNFNEWTRVNLGSLSKMREQFRKVGISWDARTKNAMENLQLRSRGGETLVGTASREMDNFYNELVSNKKIRFNTDDQVAMHFLKIATEQEMAKEADFAQANNDYTSVNSIGANVLSEQHSRVNAVLGAMRSESGVGLGYGTVEARLHPDYGLQVRQLQMIRANKGEPLNNETQEFLKTQWEKEKELMKREQEVKEEGMKAEFEKQISELQKQHEAKLKQQGDKSPKEKASFKLRNFAKGLRTSDEFDKFIKNAGGNDATKAGFNVSISLKEAVANAAEHIADLLDKGEKIGEAIKEAAIKFKGDLDENEFSKILRNFYNKASLPDREYVLESIRKEVSEKGVTEITSGMVANNHIKDYVNSFIGEIDQKDLLNEATKGLKAVLPDATKKQLIEAYLKEGDFRQPNKEDLNNGINQAKKQLISIAKLEEDIEDLNNLRGVRQRSFPTEREKSEYEKKLYDEKQAKVKEISDRAAKIREDNNKIEKERDRQLKVIQDLKEKKENLEKGLRRKVTKSSVQEDTPEIENLKKQVKEADNNLREAEAGRKKLEREVQNKKDKIDELNANIERARNDRDLIKTYRGKSDKEIDNDILNKQKELKKVIKSNTSDERLQKQLLDKAKKDATRKLADFKQKLDKLKETGELEGAIKSLPATLKKEDAELINIRRALAKVNGEYREYQNKLKEKEDSATYKIVDIAKSLYVNYLIGSPKTIVKIGWMGFIKPATDVGRRLAFGKVFHLFSPEIASAAKRGGESSSWRTVKAMTNAYFRQLGEKGIQKMYEKGEREYYEAYKRYTDYATSEAPLKSKLSKLKKDMDNKQFITLGNFMHQFVGGSSIKDAYNSFIHRLNYIEKQFGEIHEESMAKSTGYNTELSVGRNILNSELGELSYIAGFVGRSHAALKSFSARASFAAGFMARIEADIEAGKKVDATRLLEIGNESYQDWLRGKYQQANFISNAWNREMNSVWTDNPKWHSYEKYLKQFLRADIAVTRVPVNILYEEAMEFGAGAFRSVYFAQKEYNKAFKQAINEGLAVSADTKNSEVFLSKEFQNRVKEIVKDMDGDMAAKIARNFQKGGIGLGLYTLAILWGGVHFGIFPHRGQKKKKNEEDLALNELNPGQVMFGGTEEGKMGETASAAIEHTPALWPLFMGLGMAQQYHNDILKGKITSAAAADATYVHLQIIEGQIPFANAFSPMEFVKENVVRQVKKSTDSIGLTDPTDTKGGLPKNSLARKYLQDNNIDLPELDNTKIKVNADGKHPEGKMSLTEFSRFKEIRTAILDRKLTNLAKSNLGSRLTKEEKKQAAITAEGQATKEAKAIMIKQGFFSAKEDKTGEEKSLGEELKKLFKKGSGGGGGAGSVYRK